MKILAQSFKNIWEEVKALRIFSAAVSKPCLLNTFSGRDDLIFQKSTLWRADRLIPNQRLFLIHLIFDCCRETYNYVQKRGV